MVKKKKYDPLFRITDITGKSHKHILRDIRNIIEDLEDQKIITEPNFGLIE